MAFSLAPSRSRGTLNFPNSFPRATPQVDPCLPAYTTISKHGFEYPKQEEDNFFKSICSRWKLAEMLWTSGSDDLGEIRGVTTVWGGRLGSLISQKHGEVVGWTPVLVGFDETGVLSANPPTKTFTNEQGSIVIFWALNAFPTTPKKAWYCTQTSIDLLSFEYIICTAETGHSSPFQFLQSIQTGQCWALNAIPANTQIGLLNTARLL